MYGSGLQKYRPSMHSPDKNEPKKMSNRKKALMALTASGILLWHNRDKLQRLIRPQEPPLVLPRQYQFFEHDDPYEGEPIELMPLQHRSASENPFDPDLYEYDEQIDT